MRNTFKLLLLSILFTSTSFVNSQTLLKQLSGKIDFVVAKDGSGNFKTITEAIAASPDNSSTRTIIFVKNGVYNERINIASSKKKLTIIGEDVQQTILSYFDDKGISSGVLIVNADDFWLMNMTIENKNGYVYDGPQAVALHNPNTDRNIVYHCKLFSFQDTWYISSKKRTYAKDCFIEGSVDYVFGPSVAVIDSCVLFCNRSAGAVITAANTNGDDTVAPLNKYGLILFNSKIMSMPGWGDISLGRPWRQKANVVYYKCDLGNYITGWTDMSNNVATKATFKEFRCTGSTANKRKYFTLSPQTALIISKTDTSAVASIPNFDSIFHPNVIPAKRGTLSSMWNPEDSLKNDKDSVFNILNKHIVKFLDTIGYANVKIEKLKFDSISIPGFSPEKTNYVIDYDKISNETVFYPLFKYPGVGFIATKPGSAPGWGIVWVVAKNKTTDKKYNIYFNKDGAYTNAKLTKIKIDTVTLPNFDPKVFEYKFELNDYLKDRFNNAYTISLFASGYVNGAKIEYVKRSPVSFPDTSTVKVTAPDGVTVNYYKIIYTTTLSGINTKVTKNNLHATCTTPINDNIECSITNTSNDELNFRLYNSNGSLILHKQLGKYPIGDVKISVNSQNLNSGIYTYQISCGEKIYSGKLLK